MKSINAEKPPYGQMDNLSSAINLPSHSTNAYWEIPYEFNIYFFLEAYLLGSFEEGRRITIAEWERLLNVLSCKGTWTLRRLRNVISSLFAKNEEQVSLFERRFDDFFGLVSDCKPPDTELINEFRALMEASVYRPLRYEYMKGVSKGGRVQPEVCLSNKERVKEPGSQVKKQEDLGKDNVKQCEEPGKSSGDHVLPGLKFYDLWLTLGKINLNFIDIPIKDWKDDESLIWDPVLPHTFPWHELGDKLLPYIDSESIDYLADCIGYYQAEIPSNNLDIPASIKSSIEAAGMPKFLFLPVRMPRTLIILEDVFAKARQWNPIAYEFSREMQLRGINVLHGMFSNSPLRFHTSLGEHLYLEDMEYERSGAIVLIFSDGQCIRHSDSRLILEDLVQWPNLAWLDLREPRSWDSATLAINTFGIDVHPASKEGITCAIRKFLTETGNIPDWFVETNFNNDFYNPDIPLDIYLSCALGCALPWAQACSLLQPVSYKLAECLRQIFFPDIPKEAIERLHNLPGTTITVSGIHFDREVCYILLKGFYEHVKSESDIHKKIMKFIIKEIRRVKDKIPKGVPSHPCLAGTIGEVYLLQLKRDLLFNAGKNSICKGNCGLCPTQLKDICPQKRLSDLAIQLPQLEDMIRKFQERFSISEEVYSHPPIEEMALICKNSFRMGDSYAEGFLNEMSVHEVCIGAFYMDVYPVTGKLWREVFEWALKNGYDFDNEGTSKGPYHPVTGISWYDVVKWANARSEMMGKEPVYYTNETHRRVYNKGRIDLMQEAVLWEADGFRLPTEAEWEKGARGGLDGHHYPWEGRGAVCKRFIDRERANYGNEATTEIGMYAPNGYGLYDMAGNVWEWCWDWYDPEWYGKSEARVPDCRGPAAGKNRVCRGGSWSVDPVYLRCSARNCVMPMISNAEIGFRLIIGQKRERWNGYEMMRNNASTSDRMQKQTKKSQRKMGIMDIITEPLISVNLNLKHNDGENQELVTAREQLMVKSGEWEIDIKANGYETKREVLQIAPMTRKQITIRCIQGKPLEMALIPEGVFRMGDSYAEGFLNEMSVHEVCIGAFYMDVYPVTGKLWREVFEWALKNGYDFDNEGTSKGPHHPVTGISWYDAVKWANARSEMMGREPVYYTYETHRRVYNKGRIDLTQEAVLWEADGFRLPTEAEWEKGARGGLDGHHYPWEGRGAVYKRFIDRERANYDNEGTTEIGMYAPNGYGLYDMAGNVWEWCWDWYDPEWYGKSEARVPDCRGPAAGENRVCRGGSWFAGPIDLRCSNRNFYKPGLIGDTVSSLGLRLLIGQGGVRRYGG